MYKVFYGAILHQRILISQKSGRNIEPIEKIFFIPVTNFSRRFVILNVEIPLFFSANYKASKF